MANAWPRSNMAVALPEELVDTIQQQVLLRQAQLQQLSIFYNTTLPSPQILVAYGTEDAYKLETIEAALNSQQVDHVVVNCRECLNQRHLLSKIFARCVTIHEDKEDLERYERVDSINALASNLRRLLQKRTEKLVVVVVGADQQKGATATLFPALARLGDLIPCLSLILISNSPRPLILHKAGVPHIHFPPYTRNQAIQILLRDPPALLPNPLPDFARNIKEQKIRRIYNQFATVIYDTLITPTTNSITRYRQTCLRLWPRFIWPVLSSENPPGKHAEWDFARLLARSRPLFQAEGEEAIQERLLPVSTKPWMFEDLTAQEVKQDQQDSINPALQPPRTSTTSSRSPFQPVQPPEPPPPTPSQDPPLLKYLPTLLLLSCYLASHTHQKHDIVLFSRLSNASSTSRRKRKYLARSRAGGISKTPTKSPSRKRVATNDNSSDDDDFDHDAQTPTKKRTPRKDLGDHETAPTTPKKERADRSMRAIFEKTSNIAKPFPLERVIAIIRAVHPDGLKNAKGIADRVYVELGELERLRLVVRVDANGKNAGPEEIMEERWKCVVGREWVVNAGRRYGVGIEGWEVAVD